MPIVGWFSGGAQPPVALYVAFAVIGGVFFTGAILLLRERPVGRHVVAASVGPMMILAAGGAYLDGAGTQNGLVFCVAVPLFTLWYFYGKTGVVTYYRALRA